MHTATRLEKQEYVKNVFEKSADFVYMEAMLNQSLIEVCYLQSLVDYEKTMSDIIMNASNTNSLANPIENLAFSHLTSVNVSLAEVVNFVLEGMLIIFPKEGYDNIVVKPTQIDTSRSVSEAQTENPIQLALDAFTEDVNMNVNLLRRKMRTNDLVVQNFKIGTKLPRDVSVLFIEGTADPQIVQLILDCLIVNRKQDISDMQGLLKVLNQPTYTLVPTFLSSELPTATKHSLMDGRVVIFMDHFPLSISFPAIVSDFWNVQTDKDQPKLYMYLFRIIRIISLIVAITTPGLYVVLNAVNPELLRIQLAVSITNSREGVPYPVLIELIFMLLIIEMVIEASIRLPKSIGPTITMIGGIILGEAVVQARLVSNFLIIIIAASTIAHFALGTYINSLSIRVYKYVVIAFCSVYGILGLMSSIVMFCFYLGTIYTFEVPYLSLSIKRGKSNE